MELKPSSAAGWYLTHTMKPGLNPKARLGDQAEVDGERRGGKAQLIGAQARESGSPKDRDQSGLKSGRQRKG